MLRLGAGALAMCAATAAAADPTPIILTGDDATIRLSPLGSYRGGMFSRNTPANPPAYDPETFRVFIGSGDRQAVDRVDIADPSAPVALPAIDVAAYGGEPEGTAVFRGVLAVVVSNRRMPTAPSSLLFYNADGVRLAEPLPIDGGRKVRFTPDGRMAVVTVPGAIRSPFDDPEGRIAIVDLGPVNWNACRRATPRCTIRPTVRLADFRAFDARKEELRARGVRIYGPTNPTVAEDVEPEDITISRDSAHAWVSLTRNNAVARVDLARGIVEDLIPLGFKDHRQDGAGLDASDADGRINIQPWPIRSFHQPDGIAQYRVAGRTYLVTANEGDPKDYVPFWTEKARVRDLPLDGLAFPDPAIREDGNLGRLQVTTVDGDTDGDGDFDELYLLGSRSFSVWTTDGERVFDSGDAMERITAAAAPTIFNAAEDSNAFDQRSDDRGPEPEHLTIGRIAGRPYLFMDFERIGGIVAYDISDPRAPVFQGYINIRNTDPLKSGAGLCGVRGQPELPGCAEAGDLEPEGLVFVPRRDSPIAAPLLLVIHEASDMMRVYRIDPADAPAVGAARGDR
jgi:hypothetical protein